MAGILGLVIMLLLIAFLIRRVKEYGNTFQHMKAVMVTVSENSPPNRSPSLFLS